MAHVDQKMTAGFAEVKDFLRVSHAGLDRRVGRLEHRMDRFGRRVKRLEEE